MLSSAYHALSRVSLLGLRFTSPVGHLEKYKNITSNYEPKRVKENKRMNNDIYKIIIAKKPCEEQFSKAKNMIWSFNLFPSSVMKVYSTFQLENRLMKKGDLIYEEINLIPGLVTTNGINIIEEIIDEDKKKGFVCHSTKYHDEEGSLSCFVEERSSGELVIVFETFSVFSPFFGFPPGSWISRYLQLQAHKKMIYHVSHVKNVIKY